MIAVKNMPERFFEIVAHSLFYNWFIRKIKSMRKLLPVMMMTTFMISCKKNNDNPNAVNSTDKNFIIQTYLASKVQIQAGQLALNKGNSSVQNFGQKIIAGYKDVQSDLIAVANKLNFSLTDTVSIERQTVSPLNELNGYSFDTAYMRSSALSQRNMLDVFQNELNNGNNTYVRYYFLNKYIDKIKTYYIEADSISRSL
jgi:predicted outer membrane protein